MTYREQRISEIQERLKNLVPNQWHPNNMEFNRNSPSDMGFLLNALYMETYKDTPSGTYCECGTMMKDMYGRDHEPFLMGCPKCDSEDFESISKWID